MSCPSSIDRISIKCQRCASLTTVLKLRQTHNTSGLRLGRALNCRSAAGLNSIVQSVTPEILYAAGALGIAGVAGALRSSTPPQSQTTMEENSAVKRENAVLVFGSTGKVGQHVVKKLLEEGRTVVAAARDTDKAESTLHPLTQQSDHRLFVEAGVDVTCKTSIEREKLWEGVRQVAVCVGPIFGRQDNGEMGYKENMTAERVDFEGVRNIAEAVKKFVAPWPAGDEHLVIPMGSAEDTAVWERIDDVIMGGQSGSGMQVSKSSHAAVWSGELIMEGGGFCGTRRKGLNLDLSAYDGIALRVRGDGQIYKINLKTRERQDDDEITYAATFATTEGDLETVKIPFREFVGVRRAKHDPSAPPLDASAITQMGFRLSRFDFNSIPNPKCRPGPFKLEVQEGIYAYKDPGPAIALLSSAAVERNAVIGDDAQARKKDIPIVQLNPGGILNYKYMGENAVRSCGLAYTIVRAVGLTTEHEDEAFKMDFSQGDRISGKISRAEAASVIAAALSTPASKGKTVEVRRGEAEGARGKISTGVELEEMFLGAVQDWQRPKRNIAPMPSPAPPPAAPSKERVEEILADPRVQAVANRSKQGQSDADRAPQQQ